MSLFETTKPFDVSPQGQNSRQDYLSILRKKKMRIEK